MSICFVPFQEPFSLIMTSPAMPVLASAESFDHQQPRQLLYKSRRLARVNKGISPSCLRTLYRRIGGGDYLFSLIDAFQEKNGRGKSRQLKLITLVLRRFYASRADKSQVVSALLRFRRLRVRHGYRAFLLLREIRRDDEEIRVIMFRQSPLGLHRLWCRSELSR